ncbi:MAG: DUF1287 domain-containing protein [Clostridia bacterium]|nr:DUF1287 domain-containing protein [Clostridia bacterium]
MRRLSFPVPFILLAACALLSACGTPDSRTLFTAEDFGIAVYRSETDQDGDFVDDATDVLLSVKTYLATKPVYKSAYYEGGWPTDGCGVCTDVVAQGLLGAGYDLRTLLSEDRAAHPEDYRTDETPDPDIDFRRVRNLLPYFRRNAITLTTDSGKIDQWQPGDIVVWEGHVGVISEHRNASGTPLVYHHANPSQTEYEQDVLNAYGEILGHFRIS